MSKKFIFIAFLSLFFLSDMAFAQFALTDSAKASIGQHVFSLVQSDQTSNDLFRKAYGERVTPENMIDVMKAFQEALKEPSRFDAYLNGDKGALTAEEQQGYKLFLADGCAACHNGPNLGGTQFKKMGEKRNYFIEHKTIITPEDLGLFQVTKKSKDLNVFKVPSLRNIALFYPYYHDGSVSTLKDAVISMGKYQVGIAIPDADAQLIVTYLKTLTAKSLEVHR